MVCIGWAALLKPSEFVVEHLNHAKNPTSVLQLGKHGDSCHHKLGIAAVLTTLGPSVRLVLCYTGREGMKTPRLCHARKQQRDTQKTTYMKLVM